MTNHTKKDLSRRNFLFQGGRSLALLASANVGMYVIGSAFKDLDGSFVAGAKCVTAPPDCNAIIFCVVGMQPGHYPCGWEAPTCTGSTWDACAPIPPGCQLLGNSCP